MILTRKTSNSGVFGLSLPQARKTSPFLSPRAVRESYRSIRFDAAICHGNSGGGLFNADGELIGITNAGADSYENVCYAIPISIVKGAADNIIYYATDGDENTEGVYAADSGLTVEGRNAKYSLDSSGIGSITEEIYVTSVESGSAADELGLTEGDRLTSIIINGTAHELSRAFDIDDIMLTVREGDELQFVYMRGGEQATTEKYAAADDQFLRAAAPAELRARRIHKYFYKF